MNKQCKSCGSYVPVESRFCAMCGGSEFIVENQPSMVISKKPAKPKKRNTALVVTIIIAVLSFVAVIGAAVESYLQYQSYEYDYYDDYDFESSEYDKGYFDGDAYINTWANIMFFLPDGFSNADESTYAAAESEDTDCGVYFEADDSSGLIYILFEKMPAFSSYDEEEYLDIVLEGLANSEEFTYQVPDSYSSSIIADVLYTKAECTFTNDYGDFANNIYVKTHGDYMIVITSYGVDEASADSLAESIRSFY